MRKLFLLPIRNKFPTGLVIFLFVIGCRKEKLPPPKFVLEGTVRLDKQIKEDAKVKVEVCRHTNWIEDKKWETTTDKWGRYKIIIDMDWFGEYYRVKASAYDKYNVFHTSDYQYGIVRFSTDKKDIWLGEKPVEEKKKRRRRFYRF